MFDKGEIKKQYIKDTANIPKEMSFELYYFGYLRGIQVSSDNTIKDLKDRGLVKQTGN